MNKKHHKNCFLKFIFEIKGLFSSNLIIEERIMFVLALKHPRNSNPICESLKF